ncbi:MAG: WG repeat-containing protein [Bacteroidota bacterium]
MINFKCLLVAGLCVIASLSHSFSKSPENNFYVFEKQGKKGLKNQTGEVVIPPKYDAIGWSDRSFSVINNITGYRTGNVWGLIDTENKIIVSAKYSHLKPAVDRILSASKKGSITSKDFTGLISIEGKSILPFKYEDVIVATDRVIAVTKSKNQYLYGLVDFSDRIKIPFIHQSIKALGTDRFAVENTEGKIALYASDGAQIFPFQLDSISPFEKSYAKVFQNHAIGLIDIQGQIVSAPKFKDIRINEDGSYKVLHFDEWSFVDDNGKVKTQFSYDSVATTTRGLLQVYANGKTWIISEADSALTPQHFEYLGASIGDKAMFMDNGKYGLINLKTNANVLPARFDSLFFDGTFVYAKERSNNKPGWSIYDTFGIRKTKFYYEEIKPFSQRLFTVKKRGHWGFADRVGNELIHCVYDSVSNVKSGMVIVKFHNEYGIIDLNGEWVVLPQGNRLTIINENIYLESNEQETLVKSFSGDLIYFTSNPLEIHAGYFIERLEDGRVWRVDFSGTIAYDLRASKSTKKGFEEIYPPSEGFYGVKIDGKYGFIDANSKLRIANRYDGIGQFSEGLVSIKLLGKWGFIDKQEKLIIQPNYDSVTPFMHGISQVTKGGLAGMIDKKGKAIISLNYDYIRPIDNDRFILVRDQKLGLADDMGKVLINTKYDKLEDLGNGYVIIQRKGKYGLLNINGVNNIPTSFAYMSYNPDTGLYLVKKQSNWQTLSLQ